MSAGDLRSLVLALLALHLPLLLILAPGMPSCHPFPPREERASPIASLEAGAAGPAVRLGLPFRAEDLRREVYGIWPFGIHGGGHPEGHGGWDLELDPDAAVIAPCDGRLTAVEDNSMFAGHRRLTLVPPGGGLAVTLDHVTVLSAELGPGASVERGQSLGRPGPVEDGRFSMIHFAVRVGSGSHREGPREEVCPLSVLDEEAILEIQRLWDSLPRSAREPFEDALCNPIDFAGADSLAGVWWAPEGAPPSLPQILTITPFLEERGRRVVVSTPGGSSRTAVLVRTESGGRTVLLPDGEDLRVHADKTGLLVEGRGARALYRRSARRP